MTNKGIIKEIIKEMKLHETCGYKLEYPHKYYNSGCLAGMKTYFFQKRTYYANIRFLGEYTDLADNYRDVTENSETQGMQVKLKSYYQKIFGIHVYKYKDEVTIAGNKKQLPQKVQCGIDKLKIVDPD